MVSRGNLSRFHGKWADLDFVETNGMKSIARKKSDLNVQELQRDVDCLFIARNQR